MLTSIRTSRLKKIFFFCHGMYLGMYINTWLSRQQPQVKPTCGLPSRRELPTTLAGSGRRDGSPHVHAHLNLHLITGCYYVPPYDICCYAPRNYCYPRILKAPYIQVILTIWYACYDSSLWAAPKLAPVS